MNKLVKVNADNTLNISIEHRLFENIRKAHTWYTSSKAGLPFIVLFAIIDITGFLQIMELTLSESFSSRAVITTTFAIAFEIAPLYIGYAICLKCYHLDNRIHNFVLVFSCIACALGIISNITYRIMTRNAAYFDPSTETVSDVSLPVTILMCILPIITSLMGLVIGCLTFDPLQFKLLRLSKKLARLKLRSQQIRAYLEEYNNESALRTTLEEEERACYEKVKQDLDTSMKALKTYTIVKTTNVHATPKRTNLIEERSL